MAARTSQNVSDVDIIGEGFLQKRSRGRKSKSFQLQRRYVLLTNTALYYFKNKSKMVKSKLHSFPVGNVKIVEDVDESEFGSWYFQVGDNEEVMYFGAKSNLERANWKDNIRKAAIMSKNVMFGNYHPKIYIHGKFGQWKCCGKMAKKSDGCHPVDETDHSFFAWSLKSTPSNAVEIPKQHLRRHTLQSCLASIGEENPNRFILQTESDVATAHDSDLSVGSGKVYDTDSGVFSCEEKLSKFGSNESSKLNWFSSCGISSEDNIGKNLQQWDKKSPNLIVHYQRNYESHISIAKFTDADKLALATQEKLYLVDTGRNENIHSLSARINSLASWSTMVAIAKEDAFTLMDMNNLSVISSQPSAFTSVGFTPDGTSILGSKCDAGNYSIEVWKISSSRTSLAGAIALAGKIIRVCIYPDPRHPIVIAVTEDKESQMLHLNVYNYKTFQPHQDKICIETTQPCSGFHTIFSSEEKGLILGYSKTLAFVDLKIATVRYLEGVEVSEDISCIGISPSGIEMILGHTNGCITIVQKEEDKWVTRYCMDIEIGSQLLAADYSYDDSMVAVASSSGNLIMFEKKKDPSSFFHPSEELPLETLTVPQGGGHRELQDDISVEFPPGFTENSSGMSFQYGVFSPYEAGPCVLPEGMSLVSAILALHPASQHTTFEKGIKITMPHFYRAESAEDCSKIKVLKAELGDYEITKEGKVLKFEKVSDQDKVSLFTKLQEIEDCGQVGVSYVEYSTVHCCFYCIGKVRKEQTENANFCLAQFKPRSLGNSDDFFVQYTLSYFLPSCYQNLRKQYPEAEYDRTMKVVQFKEQNGAIEIKIRNDAQMMETSGWVAEVTKGKSIFKRDVYFWNFPRDTVEWMCEEKMHPPGFTIKISTTEYRCRNINIAVTFTGAMITESRYEGDATIDYTVELKSSDVCSEAAKERMVVLSPPKILNSSQSYEAVAAQTSTEHIAKEVDSPDDFVKALHSKSFLTSEEDQSLRMDLQSASLKDKENRDKNFHIMLEVHRKISENSHLFFNLCGALEDIRCFRLKKLLYDTLQDLGRSQGKSQHKLQHLQ